jgi:hypothetical protein
MMILYLELLRLRAGYSNSSFHSGFQSPNVLLVSLLVYRHVHVGGDFYKYVVYSKQMTEEMLIHVSLVGNFQSPSFEIRNSNNLDRFFFLLHMGREVKKRRK